MSPIAVAVPAQRNAAPGRTEASRWCESKRRSLPRIVRGTGGRGVRFQREATTSDGPPTVEEIRELIRRPLSGRCAARHWRTASCNSKAPQGPAHLLTAPRTKA